MTSLNNDTMRMFDVLGWTEHANYANAEWNALLQGKVPIGTNMIHGINPNMNTNSDLTIDAVVFLFDNGLTIENVTAKVTSMKNHIEQASNKVLVFGITKLDKHSIFNNHSLRNSSRDTSVIDSNSEFKQLKLKLYIELAKIIPNPIIVPLVSYDSMDSTRISHSIMEKTAKNLLVTIIENVNKSMPMDEDYDLFGMEEPMIF